MSRSSTSSTCSQNGHDRRGEAASRDRGGLLAELLAQPPDDRVHLAREAEHHAGLDRLLGALADRVARLLDVHSRKARGAGGQRLERDLDPGRDHAAEVLALGGDHVVVDRGAEVHRDARAADALVGGDGVHEPVGAELLRAVDPDRHAGLQLRAHERAAAVEVALDHQLVLVRERGHDRGHDRGVHVRQLQLAQAEQAGEHGGHLVGRREAGRGEAPVVHELVVREHAHVGLGVADVDGEQHAREPKA